MLENYKTNEKMNPYLDLQTLRERTSKIEPVGVNFLVAGPAGSKKTLSLKTARAPVLLHSFDSGGALHLKDQVDSGRLIYDSRWETLNTASPKTFTNWNTEFDRLRKINYPDGTSFFDHIGTYVIDSGTSLRAAIMAEVLKKPLKNSSREVVELGDFKEVLPIQRDYGVQMNIIDKVLRRCTSLPCDFIFICHVKDVEDKATKSVYTLLDMTGQLQRLIPTLFSAIFFTTKRGGEDVFQTEPIHGRELATRSRLSSVQLEKFEPMDYKAILEKSGLPHEDLSLFTEEPEPVENE